MLCLWRRYVSHCAGAEAASESHVRQQTGVPRAQKATREKKVGSRRAFRVRHASRGPCKWGLDFTSDSPVTTPARARPVPGDWLKNSDALRSVAAADRHAQRGVPGDWLSDSDFRWGRMIWCATRRRRASSATFLAIYYVRTLLFHKCQCVVHAVRH
jgi:hypothetical protein